MDFSRSPDAHSTSDDNTDNLDDHAHLSSSDDDRGWNATQQDSMLLDPEDDLSLGTDAHVFMSGVQESTIKGYDHLNDEVSRVSLKNGGSGSELARKRKLVHLGRTESRDSITSDISDLSRMSHDVNSLLNAMTADPEDILTNLGFAEPDLRMRIPERFLQSPSKARGIDVEWFRVSLDQDDAYGSSSQMSPSWSDPGFSRLPLRFIKTETQCTDMVPSAGYSSVPLISEPDEVPEDFFDLMRHLRLNKPQHATKGMFLEPLVEELEVSSVGSGTVRTKLSRKLSNEEGTIVREESLDKGILATDVLLDVPHSTKELDMHVGLSAHGNAQSHKRDECGIIVTIEQEQSPEKANTTDRLLDNVELTSDSLSPDAVHRSLNNEEDKKYESDLSDYNRNYLPKELSGEKQQEFPSFSWATSAANHLKAASIEIQDSFDLEEIGTEDSNDRDGLSVADQETSASVKSSEKRLTRENSGESSGFEEMIPEKETNSPSASSPALCSKTPSDRAQIVESERRPLMALLDPDVISSKLDVSPRAMFAQRRTRSLTKQRPVDEDVPCETSTCLPETRCPAGQEGALDNISRSGATTVVAGFGDQSRSITIVSTGDKGLNLLGSKLDCEASQETYESEKNSVIAEQPSIGSDKYAQQGSERPACQSFNKETLSFTHEWYLESSDNSALGPSEHCNLYSEFSDKVGDDTAKARKFSGSFIPDQIDGGDVKMQPKYTDPFQLSPESRESKSELNAESRARCIDRNLLLKDIFSSSGDLETSLPPDHVGSLPPDHVGSVDACASTSKEQERRTALQKVESEYHQHYLHEINVLEESIQKYETKLSFVEPLDSVRSTDCSKKVLKGLTEEVSVIRELRSLINKELERMKCLLEERRIMLLSGATKDPLSPGVSQRMADLLREQSSLRAGLSNISDELSIRRKACRRARLHAYIDSAKRQLKEERERCTREFTEGIKEALSNELSQKFSSEIELLRREVRSRDAVIDQLMMKIAQGERS